MALHFKNARIVNSGVSIVMDDGHTAIAMADWHHVSEHQMKTRGVIPIFVLRIVTLLLVSYRRCRHRFRYTGRLWRSQQTVARSCPQQICRMISISIFRQPQKPLSRHEKATLIQFCNLQERGFLSKIDDTFNGK